MPAPLLRHSAVAILSAFALSACSSGYDDTYYEYETGGVYNDYAYAQSSSRYGTSGGDYQNEAKSYGSSRYDAVGGNYQNEAPSYGSSRYGGQYGAGQDCSGQSGGSGWGQDAAHFSGNLRRSRYSYSEYSESYAQGCAGVWMIPVYHIVETPAPEAPPVTTTTTTTTIETSCPDGQYKMADGNCAIMITEEPPQYEPPVYEPPVYQPPVTYPPVSTIPPEVYTPIRK